MAFSERFKELKGTRTISEISEATGIGYDLISSYLQGRRNPSAINMFRIAKFFGVSCESFMECEESPTPKKKRK